VSGETVLLLIRLGFSLSLVFGLMWVAARVLKGRAVGLRRAKLDHLEVLERKALGKGSSVALVRVGDEVLTVGITEHSINLLGPAQVDLDELLATEPPAVSVPVVVLGPQAEPTAPVAADATAPRSFLDVLRDRTVRHIPG